MICPDLLALSQFLDDELDAADTVRTHVDACTACATRLGRVRRAERVTGDVARADAEPITPATAACLTPSQLVAWLDPTASERERRPATAHLEGCDHCLGEVLEIARTTARLRSGVPLPVPAHLTARVAAGWATPAPARSLTALVVALTRAGAQLVERHVAAPFRECIELAHAAPALRAAADVATLQFELRADGTRIRTTVVPTGDAVGVTITLVDDDGAPLPAQRVSLQRHGRAVFSARTDASGQIALPTLERGVYEVACPGVSAAFRLDLRASI